MDLAPVK